MGNISYKLEIFEGPLDLLLHLIHKNKLDIKDIQISILLDQYMEHIKEMENAGIYVESEFINMISRLIYIKTVSLLPKNDEEKTLKEELSKEIIKHQELKLMAQAINDNIKFNMFTRTPKNIAPEYEFNGKINIKKFVNCYLNVYKRANKKTYKTDERLNTITSRKIVSIFSGVMFVLRNIRKIGKCAYLSLFKKHMSRSSIIATFLAILELIKIKRIKIDEKNIIYK